MAGGCAWGSIDANLTDDKDCTVCCAFKFVLLLLREGWRGGSWGMAGFAGQAPHVSKLYRGYTYA